MITKEKMDNLKQRFVSAKTEEERNAISEEISAIIRENAETVASITLANQGY